MSDARRQTARQLCREAIERGEPLAWFEELYSGAKCDVANIPWADQQPNPNVVAWYRATGFDLAGKRCLKVGCGLGDDCEYLQAAGGVVTGFDISPAAIDWCRRRFPDSSVTYQVGDLFQAPAEWSGRFDFVLESYTLQVLPDDLRPRAMHAIANFVAPGGSLLVVCRGRSSSEPTGQMPWPLTKEELDTFESAGLSLVTFEDFHDDETPPVHRFRALYRRK